MKSRNIAFLLLLFLAMPIATRANDTLQFKITNLPCTDHYTYLNNCDSSSGSYDTLFSRGDFSVVFDSVGHFIDTTFYTIKSIPQAQFHIVFDKITNHISYVHFTSGAIIGTKSVTFALENVIPDLSLPPTHFHLHGDTIEGHNFSFSANYRFITSGGYGENDYASTGLHRDSSSFSFSLTPEVLTAVVELPAASRLPLVYPNPASSVLHIQFPEYHSESLSIYDATGKRVLNRSGIEGITDLNVSSLANGIYLMRAGSFSKELVIRR